MYKLLGDAPPENGGGKRVYYKCGCGKTGMIRKSRFSKSSSCKSCKMKRVNKYRISGDNVMIDVSTDKFPEAVAVIDLCFLDNVIDGGGRWYATDYGSGVIYVVRSKKGLKLHRHILMPDNELMVDHIDGNGLNNKIVNLRIGSALLNARNQAIGKRNKTGVLGVHRHSDIDKYVAQISNNHKTIHLGCFDTIEEAKKAREDAMTKFGYPMSGGNRSSIKGRV